MDIIFDLLNDIKKRYPLYIGRKSLEALSMFLNGYAIALYQQLGIPCYFGSKFLNFVQRKNRIPFTTKHWAQILQENKTEEEAFDLFFEYLEEFKKTEIAQTPDPLSSEDLDYRNW